MKAFIGTPLDAALTINDVADRLTFYELFFKREMWPHEAAIAAVAGLSAPPYPQGTDPVPEDAPLRDDHWDVDALIERAEQAGDATLTALAHRCELLAEMYTDMLDLTEAAETGEWDPTFPNIGTLH